MENTISLSKDLILRPVNRMDAQSFLKGITSDVVENLRSAFPHTIEDIEEFIRKSLLNKEPRDFVIVDKKDERTIIGGISYIVHEDQSIELAYLWLEQHSRNKGIGTNALIKLSEYVSGLYPGHLVFVQVYDFNDAEKKILTKLGFRKIGSKEVEYDNKMVELHKYQYIKLQIFQLNYDILSQKKDKITFRKLGIEDVDKYHSLVQDKFIQKFLRPTFPLTREGIIDFIKNKQEGLFHLVIIKEKKIIGGISVSETEENSCELLNFWIEERERNKGEGTNCIKNLGDIIFETTQICKIYVYCISTNEKIQHLSKSVGFIHKREKDKPSKNRNGETITLHYYEKCKPF